jgi:Holliday junction resolvase RusA-like endonuclease
MTFIVTFGVDGIPVAKGRPRFARQGSFVKTYTDQKTLGWERQVQEAATIAMGSSEPLETPVTLYLYFRLPIPASWSKKRQERAKAEEERPAKKPDWDNLSKAVCDALNGVVYKDDGQIISAHIKKVYSTVPGVDIMVSEDLL